MEKKQGSELHEIKNKRRPRAVKNKRSEVRLKTKRRMKRTTKALLTLTVGMTLAVGVYFVGGAFFKEASRNTVNLGYGSAIHAVAEGERFTESTRGDYSPVDIFARLNWTFAQQTKWYGEMHGTVDTVIQQDVATYKQYNNGILISADLTHSSLVSGASQFCYLKDRDRVMWRKPAGGPSTYDGLNTVWKTGEPYRSMTISGPDGFKATNGLPAYELSVYVIEEDTVAHASEVTETENGRYCITYELKPENWQEKDENGNLITKGATAYYANQMIFTGGLPEAPVFSAISVTFTFDSDWKVYQTDILESYAAKYGPIAAPCTSTSTTVYEYDTPRAESSAYADYFAEYADAGVDNGPVEEDPTALDCLASAFGDILTGPASLDLSLTVDGVTHQGEVDLDLSGADLSDLDLRLIRAKAKLGAVSLWFEDGVAYLSYGGLRLSVGAEEVLSLIGGEKTAREGGESDDLLAALAGGTFLFGEGKAELHSVLPLGGMELPIDFYFDLDEKGGASLDRAAADLMLSGISVRAELRFGTAELDDLSEAEKGEYVDVMPYAQSLIGLFTSPALRVEVGYEGQGVSLKGEIGLMLGDFAVRGDLDVSVSREELSFRKPLSFAFDGERIYLDLDGIRLFASAEEVADFASRWIDLSAIGSGETPDVGALVNLLLTPEFAANLSSAASEGGLALTLKGTELLRAFGVEFDLGDVLLGVTEDVLTVRALGADLTVAEGETFAIDPAGYTAIMPYAEALVDLFAGDGLLATVEYEKGDFSVRGTLSVDPATPAVSGEIALGYRSAEKTIFLQYFENNFYLDLDGIKVKASVPDAIALVGAYVGAAGDADAMSLVGKALSLEFGSLVTLSEGDDALSVVIKGSLLLGALGVDFDLGDVTLSVSEGQLTLEAAGARAVVTSGGSVRTETDGYVDILPYVEQIVALLRSDVLRLDVAYAGGQLRVSGSVLLDLDPLSAQAELNFAYGAAEKTVRVHYGEEVLYLDLDGLRLKANVREAAELVKEFVSVPEGDGEAGDLIETLLSLDLGELAVLTEAEDTLTLALAGNTLLAAFGIEFDLGTVTLSVSGEEVSVEALGARVTISAGDPFDFDKENYLDIVTYAKAVLDLYRHGYLKATVSYKGGTLAVAGEISVDLNAGMARGDLSFDYGRAHKEIGLIFRDGAVYLELDGLKLMADVGDAAALIGRAVGVPASDKQAGDLLEKILCLDFGELISLDEEDGTLTVALAGNLLLGALGVEFDLGTVTLSVSDGKIEAEALGAAVTLVKGEPFSVETEGYLDVVKYADRVLSLLEGGYLTATVSYTGGSLSAEGAVLVDLAHSRVRADLRLTYGYLSKSLVLSYADDTVYLAIDGLKFKANVPDAVALIEEFVSIPSGDTAAEDLIERLLSLDFGEVVTLSEQSDLLTVTLAGTELLGAFGIPFGLGQVTVGIGEDFLYASALGAEIAVAAGEPFSVETKGYLDLVKYAEMLLSYYRSGYLTVWVSYTGGRLSVYGSVKLDLTAVESGVIAAAAELSLDYGEAHKSVELYYADDTVYLTVDGLKIRASVSDAVGLVERFGGIPSEDLDAHDLLLRLFSLDFSDLVSLWETETALGVAVSGNALYAAFGADIGDLYLTLSDRAVTVSAAGVELVVTKGGRFTASTEGYLDLLRYANAVLDLYDHGLLEASVSYANGKLSVLGTVQLDLRPLAAGGKPVAQGTFSLAYGNFGPKSLDVVFAEDALYLTVAGVKVKAALSDAVDLVGKFVSLPASGGERDLLEDILSLDFGELITLTERDGVLSLAIAGNTLLGALGVDFGIGNISLALSDGAVVAEAAGVTVTVTAGETFSCDLENYYDLGPAIGKIIGIAERKGVSFSAQLELSYDSLDEQGTVQTVSVVLDVTRGAISWENGFELYAEGMLSAGGSLHALKVYYSDAGEFKFAYGDVGLHLVFSEIGVLKDALVDLYNRAIGVVNSAAPGLGAEKVEDFGALAAMFADLIENLKGLAEASGALDLLAGGQEVDWTELLSSVEMGASDMENGILALTLGALQIDLLDEMDETKNGFLGAKVSYLEEGTLSVGAFAHVDTLGEFPSMPDFDYLTMQDVAELIDYIGAAIELVSEKNLSVAIEGTVISTEAKYEQYNNEKYTIKGNVEYASENFPISVNPDGKHIVVSPEAYLHVNFSMLAKDPSDKSIELDILVLDAVKSGENVIADGVLDFYISVSTVGTGKEGYRPLKLYAPADEVMTLLSGICVMFDIDPAVLNDYMISKWLTVENEGQLKGLGESLRPLLGNLLGIGSLFGTNDKGENTPTSPVDRGGLITALKLVRATEEQPESFFSFSLNSDLLYGKDGLGGDITVTIKKARNVEGKTLLSSISLENIFNKAATEKTTLSFAISTPEETNRMTPGIVQDIVNSNSYFNVQKVDTLILALAKSATHGVDAQGDLISGEQTPHHYELNQNFYINGSAKLNLALGDWNIQEITIKVIAISVNLDEEGKVGINLRLEYDGLHMSLAGLLGDSDVIKGDSTLDLTIKQSPREGEGIMLYMKRTQTSEFSGGTLGNEEREISPIILYRALPLDNFMKNYIDHLCFMFNLSETVMDRIMDMVSSSGSGGGSSTQPSDLGAYLDQFVKGCSYVKTDEGDSWRLETNAEGFTGNSSFKQLVVAVGTDAMGYLRSITADLDIANVVIIHADLMWRNPGGKMDEGIHDITVDVAKTLEDTMSRKLQNIDWEAQRYLDAQLLTVRYYVPGKSDPVGTQTVAYDPNTKEFYSALSYPDLAPYAELQPGYMPTWDGASTSIGSAYYDITAKNIPNRYHLVFKSEEKIEGAVEWGYTERFDDAEHVWVYEIDWTYSSATPFELPFSATQEKKIESFTCSHGHTYTEKELHLHVYDEETVTFTAKWEYIDYTVQFMVDGKVFDTKTGRFGDQITEPAGIPQKEGYTFVHWEDTPETFSGNAQVNAVFEANAYEVTILSDHDIPDGSFGEMFKRADKVGEQFAWILTFIYDKEYKLPQNVTVDRFILHGFKRADDNNLYYTSLPNVLDATTFTAVWEELGVDVYFEGVEEPLNRKVGSQIDRSDMPAVPVKKGHTGEWVFEGDTYTVPAEGDSEDGRIVIRAKYTPITYIIYGYSRFKVPSFERVEKQFDWGGVTGEEYYVKRLEYTYGKSSGYELHEGIDSEVKGYDFDGWYPERFGAGGSDTKVTVMTDELFEKLFGLDNIGDVDGEGLEGKNVLYANWVDNSVTVYLYSDYRFSTDYEGYNGSSGQEGDLSYAGLTLYDHNYSVSNLVLNDLRDDTDLQQFGLWYKNGDKWENISDIEQFKGGDSNGATVKLYVMWIEKLHVTIESLVENVTLGTFRTYDISGVATGGAPMGETSNTIFDEAKLTKTVTGVYRIYTVKGEKDDLASGKQIAIGADGKISEHALNSANAQFSGGANYAGIVATVTFESADKKLKLSTSWDAVVSIATYKVQVMDGEKVLKEADVRLDCPFDEYDNTTYVSDIVKGVTPEAREHYDWAWDYAGDTPITGTMNIHTLWSPKSYEVKLLADEYLGEGWVKDADYDSKYVYTTHMRYGETITFWMLGKQFGETYTVTGDLTHDVFTLPEKKKFNDTVEGTWKYEIGENGATFTVVFDLDTVNYKSDLSFVYQEASTGAVTEQFNKESVEGGVYKLLRPADVTVDGITYTFVGWFKQTDSGWECVTEIAASEEGAEKVNLTVEALWVTAASSMSVSVTGERNVDTKLGIGNAYFTVTAEVQNFAFKGAPAEAVSVSANYYFYASNDEKYAQSAEISSSKVIEEGAFSRCTSDQMTQGVGWGTKIKEYGHAVVTLTIKDAVGNVLVTLGGDDSMHSSCQF